MHTSDVFCILSTTGELCVSGVLLTAVSILSVSLLFGLFVFIRSLLKSGEKWNFWVDFLLKIVLCYVLDVCGSSCRHVRPLFELHKSDYRLDLQPAFCPSFFSLPNGLILTVSPSCSFDISLAPRL